MSPGDHHDAARPARTLDLRARAWLERELERFDPEVPIEAAHTPPASWYTAPEFLALERERLFARSWQPVARLDELPAVGAFVAGNLLGQPYVVVRGERECIYSLRNVCSHHAATIVRGSGRCQELVCPYHGWAYALDGRLVRARGIGGIEHFDRESFALARLPVRTWGPWVFTAWQQSSLPFDLNGLPDEAELFGAQPDPLRFVARREYLVRSNWKVVVDNYLDGGFHVPILHGELAASLDLATYRTHVLERKVVQETSANPSSSDRRVSGRALYAWLYPNWMLNRYGPWLDVNRVLPLDAGTTRIVYDYFVEEPLAQDEDFVASSLEASHRVQLEDTEICERVQEGLQSGAYDQGRYAPRFEIGAHHFHCLLAADLAASGGDLEPSGQEASDQETNAE